MREFTLALLVSLAFGASVTSAPASACGGVFCSTAPVDQTAEHVLFTINDNFTVSAYVQIRYAGSPGDFAWVIPVFETPELDVFPQQAFQQLDSATTPRYQVRACTNPLGSISDYVASVSVLDEAAVGPYQTATIEGTSGAELVAWLRVNGYRITEAMTPIVQDYADAGMKFLALKLRPDADVSDIEPIVMTYSGDVASIPLELTRIAAQPEMGLVVWILADRRYASTNYPDLVIDDSAIEFNWFGPSNYRALVSREVDRARGQAFITEYAQPTQTLVDTLGAMTLPADDADAANAREALTELLQSRPYITRLYTLIDAEEMTIDPIFGPSIHTSNVDNLHMTPPDSAVCGGGFDPCTFVYCGRHGACVSMSDGSAACVCTEGAAARAIQDGSSFAPYCESLAVDFADAPNALGAVSLRDPCDGYDCGDGRCVPLNGSPVCVCDEGRAAVARASGLACVAYEGEVPSFPNLPPIPRKQRFEVVLLQDPPIESPPRPAPRSAETTGEHTDAQNETRAKPSGTGSRVYGCQLHAMRPTHASHARWLAPALTLLLAWRRRRIHRQGVAGCGSEAAAFAYQR